MSRDDVPVYYREVQKNGYLKRIPNEPSGSKLRPLAHKKPPLKPMWTLFCVHNGRTPYLEQYESTLTLSHKPVWRASLSAARHVTASVQPRAGREYDFLVDTDDGAVRMLAPDWESMQDWVTTLRNKLHELKILSKGENVYCSAPAAPPPRAAARDPTSPLPPTPPVPPDRVPGIELITPAQPATAEPQSIEAQPESAPEPETENETIDISNWDTPFSSLPGTSQETTIEPNSSFLSQSGKNSVAKICGQNICLDDSVLKRTTTSTDSDEEFFAEIDRVHRSIENLGVEDDGEGVNEQYTQRVVVNENPESSHSVDIQSERRNTNITVIQVSNKPPHTAIPVLGPETDVFDFEFKQKLSVNPPDPQKDSTHTETFINIVNTEDGVRNGNENVYGTVFAKEESDYGHLSLATTVNVTDNDGVYERLCMASTSNTDNTSASPLPLRKVKRIDKIRKSSLPNLDTSESTYEYLFPNTNHARNNNANITNTTLNSTNNDQNSKEGNNCNNEISRLIGTQTRPNIESTRNISYQDNSRTYNSEIRSNISNTGGVRSNICATNSDTVQPSGVRSNISGINSDIGSIANISSARSIGSTNSDIPRSNINNTNSDTSRRVHVNLSSTVSVGNIDPNSRSIRSNVERSHSQNAYDTSPRLREPLIRRVQNNSPKRDGKSEKADTTQTKPIWKRGLTELSFLSRLRGIGQGRRHESPTRQDGALQDREVTSPVKVVHRSRAEARVDGTRRRSSSLSNGQSPPLAALVPLRARQAAALRAEQRRGAAAAATVPAREHRLLCDHARQVWVAWWAPSGVRCGGRVGDRVAAVRGVAPRDAPHARQLLNSAPGHTVDILFHKVPLGKIYILNKRDLESIGIKLDSECSIASVEAQSPAARAGLPPPGKWAVTEVNNRPINLLKGGEEEMNRLSAHGSEVSVLIQPAALVKKIRAVLKANKSVISNR